MIHTPLNPKLLALSGDALLKLREEVNAAYEARRNEFLQPGRICWFHSEKHNRKVRVKITGFGIKYVQAMEINDFDGVTGMRWKLPPLMLNPELPKVKPVVAKGVGADAPQHAAAGSF